LKALDDFNFALRIIDDIQTTRSSSSIRLQHSSSYGLADSRSKSIEPKLGRLSPYDLDSSKSANWQLTCNKLESTIDDLRRTNAHLVDEINYYKQYSSFLRDNAQTQHDQINGQLGDYQKQIEHEKRQIEEISENYSKELCAIRRRYENELSIQNKLMQQKYDCLVSEINQLNETIRCLKEEKSQAVKYRNQHELEYRQSSQRRRTISFTSSDL
jgi:archaellum component FlaC